MVQTPRCKGNPHGVCATWHPGRCSCLKRWVHIIACLSFVHLGEATNPGPEELERESSCWHLGTFNPSGLNGKQQVIAEHLGYGDIWAISETHLSSRAMFAFRRGLKASGNPYRYVVGGHPTPPRPRSEHSGTWRGVAVMSKHPTRAVPISWQQDVFQSSRIQLVTTMCHDMWVTGAVVYGEPCGQAHPEAQAHTEKILQCATEAVTNMPGLRYIAGDVNFEPHQLEMFSVLESYGFRDLQDIASSRWGVCPAVTCKGKTRKDYCYISLKLQELLEDVFLEHDVWSDHSVLVGKFRGAKQVARYWWRTPQEFSWPPNFANSQLDLTVDFANGDPSDQYRCLWQQIEKHAKDTLHADGKQVSQSQCGRGQTLDTLPRKGPAVPVVLKPSRSGDVQPEFHGQSRKHALWFRQLRRLQTFARFRRVHTHDTQHAHGVSLWRSILTARGFAPSFSHWWQHECSTHLDGAPVICPIIAPDHDVASAMYFSFASEVRALETALKAARCKYAKDRRKEQAHVIFKDIQRTPPDRVELMLNSQQSIITAVDHDTLMVSVSPPITLEADKPCFAGGKERVILHSESSEVFLMDVEGLKVGDQVVQTAFTGKVDDLFELFRAEWSQRWDRHRHVPPSQWQQIMEFNARHLPRQACPYLEITDRQLQAEIARQNPKRASGPDGVSLSDLRQLPLEAITAHTKLLKRAEMDGSWPSQTLVGRVASLGKVEHPTKITDFRPITVISHIYRLWSGLRAKEILQWLDGVCPPFLLGNRPSCMASHSWSHVQWMIEVTFWQQSSLAGLTADIQKAFNHLPREVLMQACLILGVPQPILLAWSGALSGLVRRFQVRDSLGPAIYSTTGCPEGCAMSCVGMLVIDIMLHKWLVQQCPICQPMSYVDDWQVLVKQPHFLQGVSESLVSFTRAVDLLLDGRKTFAWTLDSGVRKTLRQQGLIVKRSAKALGSDAILQATCSLCDT